MYSVLVVEVSVTKWLLVMLSFGYSHIQTEKGGFGDLNEAS